jgi:hypothetical protein
MPLTPAHAAMAWPISAAAKRLPIAAVIVGTLSPDFEYLARLAPRGQFAHSLLGVALFCVPVSIGVWALFESVVRPAVVSLLPRAVGDLLAQDGWSLRRSRARDVVLAALGAFLGALSHVAWDSFTHESGWAVARIPVLVTTVALPLVGELRWYKLLQHGSTVAGSFVVILWLARAVARVPHHARSFASGQAARGLRAIATVICVSIGGGLLNGLRARGAGVPVVLGFVFVGAMLGLALGMLGVAMAVRGSAGRSD